MGKKEQLDKIKDLTKQVINFQDESGFDKLVHFVCGRGGRHILRGSYNGKKAFLEINDQRVTCAISFAVEMNTDFISKWKKILSIGMLVSKYKNVSILAHGYLMYFVGIKQMPVDMIGVAEIKRCVEKLFQLARDIESNQKAEALATFTQIRKMQREELDWWGKE